MGMRERARHFGGRIDITSAPGEGTRMCLTIALPRGGT
jgi:signal transduction histidine kinase